MLLLNASRLIHHLLRVTRSEWGGLFLQDEAARVLGGRLWHRDREWLRRVVELEPVLRALAPANEIHEQIWDARRRTAFASPDALWVDSLIYRQIARPIDCRHVALYCCPARAGGGELLVLLARGHRGRGFAARELRVMEGVCRKADKVLANIAGNLPRLRHAHPDEHAAELDAQLRLLALSPYLRAMLAFFYGETHAELRLPEGLEHDIRHYRAEYLRSVLAVPGGFFHAFTKARRGRVLCLNVQSNPGGTFRLTLHQDVAQHDRLRRIKTACAALARDRTSVFSACLVIAEGVQRHEEIARRAGLAALKTSSVRRIINRARSIVAAA
jgi:hypothetical protein